MQTNTRKRGVSVLLILAMLIVSVAALVPVAASASPVGANASDIQDFMFQTLSDANQDDTQTDLRFLFSIGDLDYDAVGFVFSKSNSAPTAGATNTFSTDTVYSSVTADGNDIPAPTGRYWVAVKLSEIPLADFESTIYVRPFIKEGDDYSYVDAKSITVCEALTFDKTVAGESEDKLYNSKNTTGNPYADGSMLTFGKTSAQIRGDDHFYPASTTIGATDGNDLWFEYSFLWNDTLINCKDPELAVFGFRDNTQFSNYRFFYYLYTKNKVSSDCPIRGHFDFSTYLTTCDPGEDCVYDLTSENIYYNGRRVGQYIAGWGAGQGDSPYIFDASEGGRTGWMQTGGWHRLGYHYHQEVASVSGSTVTYEGYTELYIDGVKVWKVKTNMQNHADSLGTHNLLLWTATASNGEITGYADNDKVRVEMRISNIKNSTNAAYVGISDIQYTCGDGFVRQVSPASLYPDREITLGNTDCSGKIWYVFDN